MDEIMPGIQGQRKPNPKQETPSDDPPISRHFRNPAAEIFRSQDRDAHSAPSTQHSAFDILFGWNGRLARARRPLARRKSEGQTTTKARGVSANRANYHEFIS
jgi:hypothetical protein